jgi:hypothetical protein
MQTELPFQQSIQIYELAETSIEFVHNTPGPQKMTSHLGVKSTLQSRPDQGLKGQGSTTNKVKVIMMPVSDSDK